MEVGQLKKEFDDLKKLVKSLKENQDKNILDISGGEIREINDKIEELEKASNSSIGLRIFKWVLNSLVLTVFVIFVQFQLNKILYPHPVISITENHVSYNKEKDSLVLSFENKGDKDAENVRIFVYSSEKPIEDIEIINGSIEKNNITFSIDNNIPEKCEISLPVHLSGNGAKPRIEIIAAGKNKIWKVVKDSVSNNGKFYEDHKKLILVFQITMLSAIIILIIFIIGLVLQYYEWSIIKKKKNKLKGVIKKSKDLEAGKDTLNKCLDSLNVTRDSYEKTYNNERNIIKLTFDVKAKNSFLKFWKNRLDHAEEYLELEFDKETEVLDKKHVCNRKLDS